MSIPYLACMAMVAAFYHLPPRALPAIQGVEGGVSGLVHRNLDGSADLGVMQVNDRWVPALSRHTGLSEPVVRTRLLGEPCFNIATAGAILRVYLGEAGGDLMQAIGYYHSHTPELNFAYRAKVLHAARRLFAGYSDDRPLPGVSAHE